jgi:hypothetical protein
MGGHWQAQTFLLDAVEDAGTSLIARATKLTRQTLLRI